MLSFLAYVLVDETTTVTCSMVYLTDKLDIMIEQRLVNQANLILSGNSK